MYFECQHIKNLLTMPPGYMNVYTVVLFKPDFEVIMFNTENASNAAILACFHLKTKNWENQNENKSFDRYRTKNKIWLKQLYNIEISNKTTYNI